MTGCYWLVRTKRVISDVVIELHTRKARAVLLMIAVACATGALVAALGISQVTARQVDADLAASTLNTVTVTVSGAGSTDLRNVARGAERRLEALPLVQFAGMRIDLTGTGHEDVTRPPFITESVRAVSLVGATSHYPQALGDSLPDGSAWLLDSDLKVAFLGKHAAVAYQVPEASDLTGINIRIGDTEFSVAGLIDSPSGLLESTVIIPYELALDQLNTDADAHMKIQTKPGAGAQIAKIARSVIRPEAPEMLQVSQVQTVNDLRQGVATQLDRFAAFIGAFLLMLTVLLIANAMTVSVMARTGEIGVRRALGASRVGVAGLFLVEGALVGALGGLAGSALAATAVVVVSAMSQWTAAYSIWLVLVGPIVGTLAGVVSSIYPAIRASGVEPALAVRSD